MINKKAILIARPKGMVKESDFNISEDEVRELEEGEILVAIKFLSLDPALRGWMNEGTTYIKGVEIGAVMRCFAAGEIIQSKNSNHPVGGHVSGLLGAQSYSISDGQGLANCDLEKGPLTWHLGVLGMPGMTAYFGLLEKGKPQAGETVFISGAAGIVGSTVGQIAKIKGCMVRGTAGSAEKGKYLTEECGFDAAINYKEEDVSAALSKHAPNGVHVFYDNVGGPLLDTALMHLGRGARVVICGAISQYNNKPMYGPSNYMKIVTARGHINGIIVFDYIKEYPKAINEISTWLNEGKMKTKEHKVNGIDNFPEAITMLFTGKNFGKLLLEV